MLTLAILIVFLMLSGCYSIPDKKPEATLAPTSKPTPTKSINVTPMPSTTSKYSPVGTWRTGEAYGIPGYTTNLQASVVYHPEEGIPRKDNEYSGHWLIFTAGGGYRMIDAYSVEGADFMQDVKGNYLIDGGTIVLEHRNVAALSGGKWVSRGVIPDKSYPLAFTSSDEMLFDGSTYVKVTY